MDTTPLKGEHPYAEKYPHLGTEALPISYNTSKERYEAEVEKIFKRAWLCIGRGEEVPEPGDYFTYEMPAWETNLLVVRGRDGKVRAFHNMCRHRGNKVVHTGHLRGKAKGFSCAFHGWTYDLSGKLVIVPDEDQFFDFDKKDHGLTQVSCEMWEGFIFVSLNPRETIEEWIGELWNQFDGYFSDLHLIGNFSADVNVNWKVGLDAFMEGYHVPFIHMKTLPEVLSGAHNPLCHLQNAHVFKWNRRISFPTNTGYIPTPIERAVAKYVEAPVFPAMKAQLEELPEGINTEKNPLWAFDLDYVFPTSMIVPWASGITVLSQYWPIAIDKTRWEMKIYWNKPKSAAERINQEFTRFMMLNVTREDMSSLETTQETLLSGAAHRFYLSDQEVAVRHSYKVVDDFVNERV